MAISFRVPTNLAVSGALTVGGTATVASTLTLSSTTASSLLYGNASKGVSSVVLSSNLTLTTGTLALAAALTGINSITAAATTDLTLTGGSSGASLVLGQGASGALLSSRPIFVSSTSLPRSSDPGVSIFRTMTGAGNGHGFSEQSDFAKAAGTAFGAFDARFLVSGTANYDHFVSFQAAPTLSTSGTTTNLYGVYTLPGITAGTVTNSYGLYAANPSLSGSGAITNSWGIYVPAYSGATNNYAATFMGKVGIGKDPAFLLDISGASPRINIADTGTSYAMLKAGNTNGNAYFGRESSAGGAILTGATAYATVLVGEGATPMQFATDATLRMTLSSTGNLLIGTTTDMSGSGGLKVAGTTASTSTTTGSGIFGGGIGVAGAINVGGNIFVAGNVLNRTNNSGLFTGTSDNFGFLWTGTNGEMSTASGSIIFKPASTTALTLTSTGATFAGVVRSNETYGFQIGSAGGGYRRIEYTNPTFSFLTSADGAANIAAGAATFAGVVTANGSGTIGGVFNGAGSGSTNVVSLGTSGTGAVFVQGYNSALSTGQTLGLNAVAGGAVSIGNAGTVTTFNSTTSGTSTTAAAILGKSMGLTENLFVGGTINAGANMEMSAGTNIRFNGGTGLIYTSGYSHALSLQASQLNLNTLSNAPITTGTGLTTFGGGVTTIGQVNVSKNTTGYDSLRINGASGNHVGMMLSQTSVADWYIYNAATSGTLLINGGGADRLSITTAGAATFSGALTAATVKSNGYITGAVNSDTLRTGGQIYLSNSEQVALRSGTDNSFNIDTYNGGTNINVLKITQAGAATFGGVTILKNYTVATLPAAASYAFGTAFVSDATNAAGTGAGTAPTGGGAVVRLVYCTGAAWLLV